MRLVWLTDIHLNFLSAEEVDSFLAVVRRAEPDAILLTGDIGEAQSVSPILQKLADAWPWPIYFVLGNHDFYGGSIAGIRAEAAALGRAKSNLLYLTALDAVELTPNVGL